MKIIFYVKIISLSFLWSCNEKSEIDLNRKLVYSEKCDILLLSNNERGNFTPILYEGLSIGIKKNKSLFKDSVNNVYPSSISCDCKFTSFISENPKSGNYSIVIYDIGDESYHLFGDSLNANYSHPIFSPINSEIAYLMNGDLKIFNLDKKTIKQVIHPFKLEYIFWDKRGK